PRLAHVLVPHPKAFNGLLGRSLVREAAGRVEAGHRLPPARGERGDRRLVGDIESKHALPGPSVRPRGSAALTSKEPLDALAETTAFRRRARPLRSPPGSRARRAGRRRDP